jgi:hypothetical protein
MGGKRFRGLGALLVPVALLGGMPAAAQTQPAASGEVAPLPAMIVLDASRSMWAKIGGGSKFTLARASLTQAVARYQGSIAFGLVAFGHRRASSCAAELRARPGELTANTPAKLLFGAIKPVVQKPIGTALEQAAKEGTSAGGSFDIVLITDGPDSCKADLCGAAKALKKGTPGLRIHVIDFDPRAKASVKALACVAKATNGELRTASNAAELKQGLTAILDIVATPAAPAVASEAGAAQPQPASAAADAPQSAPVSSAAAPPISAAETPSQPSPGGTAPQEPSAPGLPASANETRPSATERAAEPAENGVRDAPSPGGLPEGGGSQSTQAKTNSPPQGEAPQGPVPGQTDMPKSAAISPDQTASPVGAGNAAQQQAALSPPAASLPVPVTFKALLTEAGPKLQSGMTWRVFSQDGGPNGARKLVSTHREAMPTAALTPGEYLVNAAYGLSNLTKKIKVESGHSLEETFVLNTGGLKLAAVQANGAALPPSSVRFDILSDEEDQFGNRKTILGDAKPGVVIRLNAGAYHVVSTYGNTNATVRVDVTVEPGKVTEATLKHAAAPVTFKLVQTSGGEALADTKWSVLTPTGDVVSEMAGALPTLILAAGDYAAVANHNGESYTTKFNVSTGEVKQIEVVMEQGPLSPEALQAITNPPPPPAPVDAATAAPATTGPDLGFDGGDPATPRAPGMLLNPGALLRPRLP